jgi:Leucine-rich repeat (LRR) protein
VIKGRKMATLNEYIERIEDHDTNLTWIELGCAMLSDADAERLMQALRNAPDIAKNIEIIDLYGNELTSINIPATLTALQELNLEGNQLTSINIPATLIALKELRLAGNQLTNIDIPATLINLKVLCLDENQLTSINIPATLITLQELNINSNQLTNIDIPATLIALQLLGLASNQFTSINIPAELIALKGMHLERNQLTSINIPATLIALQSLHLQGNQLTTMDIPATLIALQSLRLSSNRLTSINIPGTLIALQSLDLQENQLTSINIPATLLALQSLNLRNNQLTSINIPAELMALLQYLVFNNNQLTAATKIAITAFGITRPALLILIEGNIPEQLTPAILQEHFQTMASTYLSIMNSKTFKDSVLGLYQLYKDKERGIPAAIISSHISEALPQKLLLENIAMLRRCFANNQMDTGTLNSWLESPEMKSTIRMFNQKHHNEITKLFDMYDRKFSDIRRMRDTRALVASSVAALTWRHKPSYGLSDNTPIEHRQNPFQLALKKKL